MKKRLLSILLVFGMITGMIFVSSSAEERGADFLDMPNDWSTQALEAALQNGLLSGFDGKIMPKDNLSRSQMATIINKSFGSNKKASLSNYTDVEAGKWYYAEMAKAVQMETFKGGGEGKLNPEKEITREEVFVVLAKAFELPSAAETVLNKFSDTAAVSSWAKNSVASLVAAGYVAGSNGQINPKMAITRAEFAQIMDNILKNYINKAGTYTAEFDGNVMVNVPNVKLKDIIVKGDLIIGDGVGAGEVTLDGVIVTGRTVLRGGKPVIIQKPATTNYTALGDSIAYGMSAANDLGYVNLLYNDMKSRSGNEGMVLQNLGVPGDKSSDLLDKLKNDSTTIIAVSNAKVITVSIGGNNLLSPVINTVASALNVDPKSDSFEIDLKVALADPNIQAKLFAAIPVLQANLRTGVTTFQADWIKICEVIKNLAPDAEIYVMTLYNPVKPSELFLYNIFNPVIDEINVAIKENSIGYKVPEVNTAFKQYIGPEALVNFSLFTAEVDPHPTTKGHEVIYQSHIKVMDGVTANANTAVSSNMGSSSATILRIKDTQQPENWFSNFIISNLKEQYSNIFFSLGN